MPLAFRIEFLALITLIHVDYRPNEEFDKDINGCQMLTCHKCHVADREDYHTNIKRRLSDYQRGADKRDIEWNLSDQEVSIYGCLSVSYIFRILIHF
jgi:Zn-finger protein